MSRSQVQLKESLPASDFVRNILDFLFDVVMEADKATRRLGEEQVKDSITSGLVAMRQALDEVARLLPEDDEEQRSYAQCFLYANEEEGEAGPAPSSRSRRRLVFDTADSERPSSNGGSDHVLLGIESAVSPRELRRVGEEFSAMDLDYTEQDIVDALGWVKTVLSDMRNVLLELDDDDLGELAQMTLIGMRIAVGTAKSTHRTLSHMCGVSPRRAPVRLTADGPADNGAGPSSSAKHLDNSGPSRISAQNGDFMEHDLDGRVLPWDPLAPRLVEGVQRLAVRGQEQPVTAVLVVAAALPFSGLAVCVGAPVLAGDAALQWTASTPVGKAVGKGTYNALELGKLWWVAGKLVTKQTLRLASRELDRVGGPTGLACRAAEGACWTVTHPIEAVVTSVGLTAEAGKAAYGQALWVADLVAAFGEEVSL